MIDKVLTWLAYRPISERRWVEDIYARAELRRWERTQKKRKAGHTHVTGQPLPNTVKGEPRQLRH